MGRAAANPDGARLISAVLDVGGRALVGGAAFPGPFGRIGQDVVVGTSGPAVGVRGGGVAVAVGSRHVASCVDRGIVSG
ncbi:conserved hypothetical protein [Rhodococcus ruber]|uniref:Uncharacterized protein n=1 Tax=Rhodococcus ruber TaxID=1830 RepID=A0A098BNZ4_9NOCA|nr:conserved hypothetical protein [Rhodococcus ruber]